MNQESAEPKYLVSFRANRDEPRWFESPYFSHAVEGVMALVDGSVKQPQDGPVDCVIDIKIYHVGGKNPGEKHLVTHIEIENRAKWHPNGQGPKLPEIPIEERNENVSNS